MDVTHTRRCQGRLLLFLLHMLTMYGLWLPPFVHFLYPKVRYMLARCALCGGAAFVSPLGLQDMILGICSPCLYLFYSDGLEP